MHIQPVNILESSNKAALPLHLNDPKSVRDHIYAARTRSDILIDYVTSLLPATSCAKCSTCAILKFDLVLQNSPTPFQFLLFHMH